MTLFLGLKEYMLKKSATHSRIRKITSALQNNEMNTKGEIIKVLLIIEITSRFDCQILNQIVFQNIQKIPIS